MSIIYNFSNKALKISQDTGFQGVWFKSKCKIDQIAESKLEHFRQLGPVETWHYETGRMCFCCRQPTFEAKMESPTSTSQNCLTMHWTRHFSKKHQIWRKFLIREHLASVPPFIKASMNIYLLRYQWSLAFGESHCMPQAAAKNSSVAFKACGYRVHEAVQRHQAIGS